MKAFIPLLLVTVTAAACFAQAPRVDSLVSPEVHPDRRVTFRVRAPKASEVTLLGDWMVPTNHQAMTKDEQGVWSATLGPLEAGLAIYTFTIDGVTTPDPVNPRIKLRARTSASLVDVPGDPPELWQTRDVPHGTVGVNWEKSKVTGDTRAYHVYTPPGYASRQSSRYPVLYLLHGNNDTAAGWTDVGKANFILDNLIAEKKAVPMIIVMPWGHAVPYGGSQSNNAATFERYVIEEVIPQVEKKYRVAPGPENRAIVGLSMGGGHALQIGLGHLDLFSAVAAFSFAVPGDFESRFQSLLADPQGTNKKLKLLWLGCGRQDPAFERNQKLSDLLTSRQVRNSFHATEGLHNFAVWRRYLADVAPLLFRK
ncbi:MAG TPA: alpha/beta hydrolase-fold protein [Verrucomicrobiae bacterium]|nr:alpha/beta hydrolase-fold protein [Verrucomicrobiae bacterium]